jgi:hypothetical protein
MRLVDVVVEASRRGDYPRLSYLEAERIIRVVAEWLVTESVKPHGSPCGCDHAAQVLRDAL